MFVFCIKKMVYKREICAHFDEGNLPQFGRSVEKIKNCGAT